LGEVQSDELRVKAQGKVFWMATSMQVSTRLWLGGVVSECRDLLMIVSLIRIVKACASRTSVLLRWSCALCERDPRSVS
jgi:hypothetical protein